MRGSHLGIAGPLLALACSEPPPPGPAPFPPGPTERLTVPAAPRRAVDLLYVIDNAGSAGEAQWEVALSFGALVATLAHGLGTQPDLHVGVISTDLGTRGVYFGPCSPPGRPAGDDGALLTNGCAGIDGTFLRDVARADGGRDVNYTGALADRFSCMARLGTGGCPFEAPLGALDRALEPGRNPGFLRPDATLAVVLVTNEDDCTFTDPAFFDPASTTLGPRTSFRCFEYGVRCDPDEPRTFGTHVGCHARDDSPYLPSVATFVERLRARHPGPRAIVAAAVYGVVDAARTVEVVPDIENDPSRPRLGYTCFGQAGWGLPPIRLADFIDAFGGNAGRVCDGDQTDTMTTLGARVGATLGVPCFAGAVHDADPAAPGVQAQCTVGETTAATGDFHLLPACTDGLGGACWRVVEDAARCPVGAHHYLAIERPAAAPTGATLTAACTIEPT
ncbi:MAG: hypothetical protein IPH44_20275 [Myxococcales bacterium]|nr:hypothetical protein [Myxococcales bacterium]